jgi:hypothetical protein
MVGVREELIAYGVWQSIKPMLMADGLEEKSVWRMAEHVRRET